MRARLGILFAGMQMELRDVVQKNKPPQALAFSPKRSVSVLERKLRQSEHRQRG